MYDKPYDPDTPCLWERELEEGEIID